MALETLKDVDWIGGFEVFKERPKDANGVVDWDEFDRLRKSCPIYIDHDVNMISFRIQDGPIKENGVNGCQVDTLICASIGIIKGLNEKFPSTENDEALLCLNVALVWLGKRKKNREARGVEGRSKL